MLTSTTGASTVVVDNSGNGEYFTIQAAIKNAVSGDIIIVNEGQYTENVVVDKELSIISNSLPSENTIIQANDPDSSVFSVQANNVTIDGFNIIGMNGRRHGICLNDSTGCSITNNTLSGNFWGIHLLGSDKNTIWRNILSENDRYGIFLVESHDNSIGYNNVNNQLDGIVLDSSTGNILRNNSVSENLESGILLIDESDNNHLYGNQMVKNKFNFGDESGFNNVDESNMVDGKNVLYFNDASDLIINASSNAGFLYFYDCENITLKDLVIANNLHGISFYNADEVSLYNISCSNNKYGLYLERTLNGVISDCNIQENSLAGVYIGDSERCSIEKNHIVNNDNGIYFDVSKSNDASKNLIANNSIGILEGLSDSNIITDNELSNNGIGIFLYLSSKNKIDKNEFLTNKNTSISLQYSDENIVTNNKINESNAGIVLEESSRNNSVSGNYLFDNGGCIVGEVDENIFFNNTCQNTEGNHFLSFIDFGCLVFVILGAAWMQRHRYLN